MENLLVLISGYFIFQLILFIVVLLIVIAPLLIWKYVKKTSQIQLDTLVAIENQNKILLELLKATTKNENIDINLEKRIREYSK